MLIIKFPPHPLAKQKQLLPPFVAEAAPAFSSSLSLVPLSPPFQAIPSLGPPSSPAPSSSSFLHYLLHPFLNLPPRLPQVHSSHIDAMPRKMPKMTPKMIPQKPLQQSPSNANFLNMRKSCQSLWQPGSDVLINTFYPHQPLQGRKDNPVDDHIQSQFRLFCLSGVCSLLWHPLLS